jgi:hypothetical protein
VSHKIERRTSAELAVASPKEPKKMLQNEKKEIQKKRGGDGNFLWGLKAKDEKIGGKINKNPKKT